MTKLYLPSSSPAGWRAFLADPDKHWVRGKSAFELAASWEKAAASPRGLPTEVAACLDSHQTTRDADLLMGIPELQVDLPGGGRPSQSDLWALLGTASGTVSLAVEAKSGESFDRPVGEWQKDQRPGSGKPTRLAALLGFLGLQGAAVDRIRYQLLHRAASALIQAQRFRANAAVLLIQSFGGSSDEASRGDFREFVRLMGGDGNSEGLVQASTVTAVPLLLGWVTSRVAVDTDLTAFQETACKICGGQLTLGGTRAVV